MAQWLKPRQDNWSANDYFEPIDIEIHEIVSESIDYLQSREISAHPFFEYAAINRHALEIWAAQEAVVTNPFSQTLLYVASQINNVHLRTLLMPVIAGEHHRIRNETAVDSHPWLLRKLCDSLKLDMNLIKPLPFTVEFAEIFWSPSINLLRSLGALGVGNERMLIPEYTAVETCFDSSASDADYKDFLRANIEEDKFHSEIIDRVASGMIRTGKYAPEEYKVGATIGVDARFVYYDRLLEYCRGEER